MNPSPVGRDAMSPWCGQLQGPQLNSTETLSLA
jgi:hypothetical protein